MLPPPADSESLPLCRPDVESFEISNLNFLYEDALVLNYPCPEFSVSSIVRFDSIAYFLFSCDFD